MKQGVKKHISEIRHIVKHMPRTLNEAVFEDFSEVNDIMEDDELTDPQQLRKPMAPEAMGPGAGEQPQAPANVEAPVEDQPSPEGPAPEAPMGDAPMNAGDAQEEKDGADALNVEQFVDDIRKKSLRGMAQLAENPDDERYQLLKKIWQICDKKPEQQTAFSNPNAAMQPKKF